MKLKRIKSVYLFVAVNLLSTLLLLITLNLLLGAFYLVRDAYAKQSRPQPSKPFNPDGSPTDNGKRLKYQLEWFDYNATREVGEAEAAEVIDDFFDLNSKGFVYQPWVQYCEPLFAGKRVAVETDEKGFHARRTVNPQTDGAAPVINIFVLGGSTTFGYYVSDERTWPSYLTSILNERAKLEGLNARIKVTNYGRAGYYPSMETALGLDLFRNGHRPNLVIFMDGINWGPYEDSPQYTEELKRSFQDLQQEDRELAARQLRQGLQRWIPMFRLAASIKHRFFETKPKAAAEECEKESTEKPLTPEQLKQVQQMLERFRQHRSIMKKVCEEYGAETIFFLQPDPTYNYPVNLYRRTPPGSWWPLMKQKQLFYEEASADAGFVSLSKLFDTFGVGKGRKAILDDVHYSPEFNRHLAEQVAAQIDLQKIAKPTSAASSLATGSQRK